MGSVLAKVMRILRETFKRTYSILEEEKVNSIVELKIIIYRNYNSSPANLLSCTAFESRPENLDAFMKSTNAKEGNYLD